MEELRFTDLQANSSTLKICFLGPDGSGKSTIIESLRSHFLNFKYFHLKPIRRSFPENNNVVVADPHKHPPYSPIKSTIKLFYLLVQYNLGWFRNVAKSRMPGSLIVFDRYFDDLLVDSRRYRFGGSFKMAKLVRNLIPRPDVYFILTADPEIIFSRKQEVPFKELQRQISSYRSLADGKRYFNVNVNRSPEEITKEIMSILNSLR